MNTHATDRVFRHLSKMRMKDRRLTEKFVEIAMWLPSILKYVLIPQRNESLISMLSLKRTKYIEKVLVKQELSIYYLIMILICFLITISWGKECFQEEKLTHLKGSQNSDRMCMKSSSFWILLPVSFQHLNFHTLHHTPSQNGGPAYTARLSGTGRRYSGEDSSAE